MIDAIHMPPNQGKKFLIVTHNDLSGWPEAEVLPSLKLKHIVKFIYKDLICQHGCFSKIVSDRGKKNKKKVKKLLMKYAAKHIIISPYNPQANGMIEQGH